MSADGVSSGADNPASDPRRQKHWLLMDAEGKITGCHCGATAEADDCGYGDSVVAHMMDSEWDRCKAIYEGEALAARRALDAARSQIEQAKPHIPPSTDPKRRDAIIIRSTLNKALRILDAALDVVGTPAPVTWPDSDWLRHFAADRDEREELLAIADTLDSLRAKYNACVNQHGYVSGTPAPTEQPDERQLAAVARLVNLGFEHEGWSVGELVAEVLDAVDSVGPAPTEPTP